jgi:hypothetical protein
LQEGAEAARAPHHALPHTASRRGLVAAPRARARSAYLHTHPAEDAGVEGMSSTAAAAIRTTQLDLDLPPLAMGGAATAAGAGPSTLNTPAVAGTLEVTPSGALCVECWEGWCRAACRCSRSGGASLGRFGLSRSQPERARGASMKRPFIMDERCMVAGRLSQALSLCQDARQGAVTLQQPAHLVVGAARANAHTPSPHPNISTCQVKPCGCCPRSHWPCCPPAPTRTSLPRVPRPPGC